MHIILVHRCVCLCMLQYLFILMFMHLYIYKCVLTYILLYHLSVWESSFILGWLSSYQSIHQLITHSCSLSLALCLRWLDLSQLFAGFKDKEILIELLCSSTSQCINRQLDINRPAFVCVHLHVCVVWGEQCTFVYLQLKAFILIQLEAAVICFCRNDLHPCRSSQLTYTSSVKVYIICVFI